MERIRIVSAKGALWWAARAAYGLVWLAVLGGLATELALVLDRRAARALAHSYGEKNLFTRSRGVSEAATLWEVRGVRYRPGARLTLEVGGVIHEIRINSRGFRTHEFSVPKPEGLLRVVCLGGSTTVQGQTNQATYPAILERMLRDGHPGLRLEVLNLGINGTGSGYWLERQDELFGYEPDVIVQYEFVNDLFWEYLPEFAEAHPLRRQVGRSLLLARLFPLDTGELDPRMVRTVRRHRTLAHQARRRDIAYVAGSFAGPDPASASAELRAYLDQNVEAWGRPLRLRFYRDYRRLLVRYNALFQVDVRGRRFHLVPVDRLVQDGSLFVDLCHMTPEGIERLAQAFLPAVSELLASRATRADRDPPG
jgi:hypothetical protein